MRLPVIRVLGVVLGLAWLGGLYATIASDAPTWLIVVVAALPVVPLVLLLVIALVSEAGTYRRLLREVDEIEPHATVETGDAVQSDTDEENAIGFPRVPIPASSNSSPPPGETRGAVPMPVQSTGIAPTVPLAERKPVAPTVPLGEQKPVAPTAPVPQREAAAMTVPAGSQKTPISSERFCADPDPGGAASEAEQGGIRWQPCRILRLPGWTPAAVRAIPGPNEDPLLIGVGSDGSLFVLHGERDGAIQSLGRLPPSCFDFAAIGGNTPQLAACFEAHDGPSVQLRDLRSGHCEEIEKLADPARGIAMSSAGGSTWISYLTNKGHLHVAWRGTRQQRWETFQCPAPPMESSIVGFGLDNAIYEEHSTRGMQTAVIGLGKDRALVVAQQRGTNWGEFLSHVEITPGMPRGELVRRVREIQGRVCSKTVLAWLVDDKGRFEQEVIDLTDNFHTNSLALDSKGRPICMTLRCHDAPDYSKFAVCRATRHADGWSSDELLTVEGVAPYHLKVLRNEPGKPFLFMGVCVELRPRVMLQPFLCWDDGADSRTAKFPLTSYANEEAAHYKPVVDAVATEIVAQNETRIDLLVPEQASLHPAMGEKGDEDPFRIMEVLLGAAMGRDRARQIVTQSLADTRAAMEEAIGGEDAGVDCIRWHELRERSEQGGP